MLSLTHEYALRAMTQLAAEAPGTSTTEHIAAATDVPAAYLAKVMQSLRRAGLITSKRGVGGGVKLARPPKKISLLEIVNAVEPLTRGVDAPKGKHGVALAPLNRKVDAVIGDLQKALAATA